MFDEFLQGILTDLERTNLRRHQRTSHSATGTSVAFQGRTLHNFASNDYLGLAAHRDVIEAARDAIHRWGAGTGASRLVTGTQSPHQELEEKLAEFKQTPAALVFSNGYATGTGTLAALVGKNDIILPDRLAHACLIDGARFSGATLRPWRHNDLNHLEHHLHWARTKHPQARIFIVTESVFSMDGDLAPLREIVELKERHGAILLLDEAHAVGIRGRGGRGLADERNLTNRIEIHMGTLGKALGSSGGYIAGSRNLIEVVMNKARSFIFSTAPPASAAVAASVALDICVGTEGDKRRSHLRELASLLDPEMPAAILPIILGDEEKALHTSRELEKLGFFVPAIRPPTVPRGTSRLRLSLSAGHQAKVVRQLATLLKTASPPEKLPDSVCPVCGATLTQEKCKVVCRSTLCGYRIVFNCSEF